MTTTDTVDRETTDTGAVCPVCGRRFTARVWLVAHVVNWPPCGKKIPAADFLAFWREWLAITR